MNELFFGTRFFKKVVHRISNSSKIRHKRFYDFLYPVILSIYGFLFQRSWQERHVWSAGSRYMRFHSRVCHEHLPYKFIQQRILFMSIYLYIFYYLCVEHRTKSYKLQMKPLWSVCTGFLDLKTPILTPIPSFWTLKTTSYARFWAYLEKIFSCSRRSRFESAP